LVWPKNEEKQDMDDYVFQWVMRSVITWPISKNGKNQKLWPCTVAFRIIWNHVLIQMSDQELHFSKWEQHQITWFKHIYRAKRRN
jgi:hypothetical protein